MEYVTACCQCGPQYDDWRCCAGVPKVKEEKDYQEQLKQMLQDPLKEKEKHMEKPLPLMNQVL